MPAKRHGFSEAPTMFTALSTIDFSAFASAIIWISHAMGVTGGLSG